MIQKTTVREEIAFSILLVIALAVVVFVGVRCSAIQIGVNHFNETTPAPAASPVPEASAECGCPEYEEYPRQMARKVLPF